MEGLQSFIIGKRNLRNHYSILWNYKVLQSLGKDIDPKNGYLLINIGKTYCALKEYYKAEDYCLKGLGLLVLMKENNTVSLGDSYNVLGTISMSQVKFQKAMEYFLKAFELSKGNHQALSHCCANLGNCCLALGEYKKAEEYLV